MKVLGSIAISEEHQADLQCSNARFYLLLKIHGGNNMKFDASDSVDAGCLCVRWDFSELI